MKYKGILFDLDGVICFTDQYHYQAWKQIADAQGIPFDQETNHRLRGVSRMESLDIILESTGRPYSEAEKAALAERKNEIYRGFLEQMGPDDLSGEVRLVLARLARMDIAKAIASSSKNTKLILEKLGLATYFDAVCDGTMIRRSKPDPEVFQKAADMLRLAPKDCLVVEDAAAGIEAAHAGGFDSAGVGEAARHASVTYPLGRLSEVLGVV